MIAGKPYVLFTDEGGGGSDISDPKNPKTISKIQLDVHDPAFCAQVATAPITQTGQGLFGFSCHYCAVDDVDDAKIAACNCFASGLRIFDISNPTSVKEIAY